MKNPKISDSELEKKAKDFFKAHKGDLEELIITSDGQIFVPKNLSFAKSHSFRCEDRTITTFKKSELSEKPAPAPKATPAPSKEEGKDDKKGSGKDAKSDNKGAK